MDLNAPHLPDLRPTPRILLSCCRNRRPNLHPRLRLSRSPCTRSSRKTRPRVSTHQHHPRRPRRLRCLAASTSPKKISRAMASLPRISARTKPLSASANFFVSKPTAPGRYYEEGSALFGLIDPESRGALWLLVHTYSALLARIESLDFAVFGERVRLSKPEKMLFIAKARFGRLSEENILEKRDRDRRRAGGTGSQRRAG